MPRAEDFMMTAEELRLRRLKRRTILIVSVALVLLLVAGYFGGRPGINAVKAWQARRHAANAFAYTHQRATEQQQLQAALLELSLGSGTAGPDERATDAWLRIEKISKGKSATALDALVLLARRELARPAPEGTGQKTADSKEPITSETLSQRLASHPLSRAPQKLLSLDLVDHATPSRHDELIAEGIVQWKDGDSDDLLALATWLSGKTEFQKTLETIPLDKALLSRELVLQYVDALGWLGRWRQHKQLPH